MAKNDASAPEGAVPPSPAEATPPRKRASKAVGPAAAAEPTAAPEPKRRSKAVVDLAATPATSPGLIAKVKAWFRVPGRRRVVVIGAVVALIGLNVWMALAVDGWRGQDASLRADNASLGQSLAEERATAAFQVEEIALVTKQAAAAQEKADALGPDAEAQQALADSLKAAGTQLAQCVADRGTLIANLWGSSASAQAGLEAEVDATCSAAQAAFEAIPEEN